MPIVDRPDSPTRRFPLWLVAGVAGLVVIVAAAAVWMLVGDDGDGETQPPPRAPAELASTDELRALADGADGPVFWAGPRPGMQYEVSKTSDGRIYIRYLPADVEPGDPRANYLTVGTYPAEDALAATRRTGEAEGGVLEELEGGGIAVYTESAPTSVYLAFPGVARQVEVYHPSPEAARELAYSGAIVPVLAEEPPPEATGRPVAATSAELEEIAADLDHPLYWIGPKPGFTYELTRLPSGQVYVRYLPKGVEVGDGRPDFETIGTYPSEDGLAGAEAAGGAGAEEFDLPRGGKAYFSGDTPTNVHFSFPNARYQVEVFHPDEGTAEELVRSGAVVPIR